MSKIIKGKSGPIFYQKSSSDTQKCFSRLKQVQTNSVFPSVDILHTQIGKGHLFALLSSKVLVMSSVFIFFFIIILIIRARKKINVRNIFYLYCHFLIKIKYFGIFGGNLKYFGFFCTKFTLFRMKKFFLKASYMYLLQGKGQK